MKHRLMFYGTLKTGKQRNGLLEGQRFVGPVKTKPLYRLYTQGAFPMMKKVEKGVAIKTEYDKAGDPPSKDCTMVMVVNEPFKEPRIHRAFPGGLEDLEVYRQEVIDGVGDGGNTAIGEAAGEGVGGS